MSEADGGRADESTWAVHFPGNLRWSNAMQIVKGMAPYAAVAMDEVDRVGRRLKARAALASEASGQRGNSIVRAHSASEDARERADDTRPEPGSSAHAAALDQAARYAAWGTHTAKGQHRHKSGVLFKVPHKVDPHHLIPVETEVV